MKSALASAAGLSLLLVIAPPVAAAGGHSHQGAPQDRGPKHETPAEPAADAGAYDPAAASELVTHTRGGAIRRVVATESADAKQIGLIRDTLRRSVDRFGPASFAAVARSAAAPASLAALQAAPAGSVRAEYFEVRAGAEIRYLTDDSTLAAALHDWLDAQAADPASGARTTPERAMLPLPPPASAR